MGTPTEPSVGGGGCLAGAGGWGGALIVIEADIVELAGTVNVNGAQNGEVYGGGGAGGGVHIVCRTLTGAPTGLISANGGNGSSTCGGAGGGRIALFYETATPWPGIRFSCSPGSGRSNPHPFEPDQGTLYLADAAALANSLDDNRFRDVTLFVGDLPGWSAATLDIGNCAFRFGATGFVVSVTGDLRVDGGRFG